MEQNQIWTIGHSNHEINKFVLMLKSHQINRVVDVRSYPGSRAFPHFNKEVLEQFLLEVGIQYTHIKNLGGRRKANLNSKNTAWRKISFRSYADYMETNDFHVAIKQLQEIASTERVAYMCAESVWWRCHRSMISDSLKSIGWKVMHIMDTKNVNEHPYTQPAKIVDGKLCYADEQLKILFVNKI